MRLACSDQLSERPKLSPNAVAPSIRDRFLAVAGALVLSYQAKGFSVETTKSQA